MQLLCSLSLFYDGSSSTIRLSRLLQQKNMVKSGKNVLILPAAKKWIFGKIDHNTYFMMDLCARVMFICNSNGWHLCIPLYLPTPLSQLFDTCSSVDRQLVGCLTVVSAGYWNGSFMNHLCSCIPSVKCGSSGGINASATNLFRILSYDVAT